MHMHWSSGREAQLEIQRIMLGNMPEQERSRLPEGYFKRCNKLHRLRQVGTRECDTAGPA
jgi:hypothetical protein